MINDETGWKMVAAFILCSNTHFKIISQHGAFEFKPFKKIRWKMQPCGTNRVHIGPQRYSGTDHTTTSSTLTLKNAFAFDFKTIENLDRSRHEKTINVNNTALKRRPSAENGGYRIGPTWSGSDIT